jgi:NAD(P)-dependent dehydrogenase (short-subunit alcohol dehydrogenase family)
VNRLDDKVAVITGAGRGIGEAIAKAFAREGATVIIAEKDAESGAAVATSIGAAARFVPTDITDNASVDALSSIVEAAFGRVDVLVNNAGINVFHDPLETTDAEWHRCLAVDLEGAWRVSRAVLPGMRAQQRGSIVNIASSHSFSIIPGTFPYPVAKHGLLGLTRSLAVEYASDNVRVNAISPGYVETQLAVDYWNGFADPEAARQETYRLHPPRRIARPDEIAMTAVFLASDEAPFINGANIVVDGGRSLLYHD